MTIVLPANSRDLAVLSKQLAAGHKDAFYDSLSSSFIATEPKKSLYYFKVYSDIKDSQSATVK